MATTLVPDVMILDGRGRASLAGEVPVPGSGIETVAGEAAAITRERVATVLDGQGASKPRPGPRALRQQAMPR